MSTEKKNVIWNIIGATAYSFTSLIFAIIATRINGTNDAGIFTFAFATACWFYIIGIYSGRVFQVTDRTEKNSDTDYIYNRIITCALMLIISIIFSFIKGYDIYKIGVIVSLCAFKAIEAFSEVFYGIMQKNGELYKVRIINVSKGNINCSNFSYSRFNNT